MALTSDQLKAMSFGYLTGGDLIKWCAPQNLIKQFEVDNDSLQDGCDTAYSEIITKFATKYDLTEELQLIGNVKPSATATIAMGVVTSINVLNGGTNIPNDATVSIVGGGGTDATADVVVEDGVITEFTITNGGTGYTTAPNVVIAGQPADMRIKSLVKILSLLAVRNVLGSMQNLSEKMTIDFSTNDKEILNIQRGLSNLPLPTQGNSVLNTSGGVRPSTGILVNDSFKTLG